MKLHRIEKGDELHKKRKGDKEARREPRREGGKDGRREEHADWNGVCRVDDLSFWPKAASQCTIRGGRLY